MNMVQREFELTWGYWPRFLLFPGLAVLGYFAVYYAIEHQYWTLAWLLTACLSVCWFCLGGSFHEAAHGSLFPARWANEIYGQLVGLLIFIPFTAYRVSHRLHHAYLNTPHDYEMWPYSSPQCSRAFRRLFVLLDLFCAVFTAPLIYSRLYWLDSPKMTAAEKRWITREYIGIVLCWSGLWGGLFFLILSDRYTPAWRDGFYLIPLLVAPMISTLRKFIEHLGMSSIDPLQGTRTIYGSRGVSAWISYFQFDISIHGPHHRYPKVRSEELPGKIKSLQLGELGNSIPVFSSYWQAFCDLWPALWKEPAVGMSQWPVRVAEERPDQSKDSTTNAWPSSSI